MKLKIWPDDATAVEMNDWLAELREEDRTDAPLSADRAEPPAASTAPVAPTAPASAAPPALAEPTVRAVIGDQIRMPITRCEMGGCISWHADPAALGEADARARAIDAGWRIDAFDRLACPRCQQTDPRFRACSPVVPWDRHTAMARAARIAAVRGSA